MYHKEPVGDRRKSASVSPCVLLVEKDRYAAELIHTLLNQTGYTVSTVGNGAEAINYCRQHTVHLIVLDSGVALLDKFAENYRTLWRHRVPLILTTPISHAGSLLDNRLLYEADDYISKPFSPRDLLFRVKRIIQRTTSVQHLAQQEQSVGNFRLNLRQRQATIDKTSVKLTANECHLLEALLQNANEPISKEQLVEAVWKHRFYNDENVLRVTMRRLRNKIERDPSNPTYLLTVYGKGYKLEVQPSVDQPTHNNL